MIRYSARTKDIESLVNLRQPDWIKQAVERTDFHRQTGRYIKSKEKLPNGKTARDFWGEVKSVFVTVQFGKCAYCETKLESSAIQWDLEHFRPKSDVTEWELPGPDRTDLARRNFHRKSATTRWEYVIPTGLALPEGYYLLAYDLSNYVASCKTCNSVYKRTYFPVEHSRIIGKPATADYLPEAAYLIYPLGDHSEDPEQYIEFEDVEAVAKKGSPRGQLIIDFFDLNREGLQRSRAEWLVHTVWNVFELALSGKKSAIATLGWLLSHEAPFACCTRCFIALCKQDIGEAEQRYQKMLKILSKTPSL